ncbi:hypothetical protein BKA93DRAFT_204389 [Sparassis latifolia]
MGHIFGFSGVCSRGSCTSPCCSSICVELDAFCNQSGIYSYITNSYFVIVVPEIGPICMKEATSIVQMKLTMCTQCSVIVADIIVLIVTWMKTYSIKRYACSAHIEAPLATLLLRDGTLHCM